MYVGQCLEVSTLILRAKLCQYTEMLYAISSNFDEMLICQTLSNALETSPGTLSTLSLLLILFAIF